MTAGEGYFGKVQVALLKHKEKLGEALRSHKRDHNLFALKMLSKADQIKRKQVTHTYSERDILNEIKELGFFPYL